MASDARISTGFPGHPKTKKLARRLGPEGPLCCLYLFLWAAANRSDGDLSGMTDEDIELAVDWHGEPDAFVAEMASVGFLDGEAGARMIHDWQEHNPWAAGAEARSEKAKWAALCKQHGRREAARLMPDYADRMRQAAESQHSEGLGGAAGTRNGATSTSKTATSTDREVPDGATGEPVADSGSAPSPSPSPSPSPEASSLRSDSQAPEQPGDLLGPADPQNVRKHPASALPEIVLDAYHEILPKCQGVAALTPKREKRVRHADKLARGLCKRLGWSYDAETFWRAYFDQCAKDPWLRGEVPNPNNPRWKQNLDVLLDEDRFAQIMDQAVASMEDAA